MAISSFFCQPCVAAMPLLEYGIWTSLAVGATVYLLLRCKKQFHRYRLIEDMPTSKVRSASQGYTELIGIARKDEHPRLAPLSGELCLWWRFTIERHQRSGKSSHWVTVEKKHSTAPFLLEDITGNCRVEPDKAEISTAHRKRWYGFSRRPSSGPDKASGVLSRTLSIGRYRYTEWLIREGDPLYVLGHFETDSAGVQSLQPEKLAGDILRSWKADYAALLERFDINRDGVLSNEEWKLVQQAAKLQAKDEIKERAQQPAQHSIAQPVNEGLPFIISNHEQERLGRKFINSARLSAAGFLLACSVSTWLLTARFFG